MGIFQLFLIGIGLSMDAAAVSICKGLKMKKIDVKYMLVLAAFFGGFQGLMPAAGWLLGKQFERYITQIDHWIAFVLLVLIGGKMLLEAGGGDVDEETEIAYNIKEIVLLAVATSIDALAVGITFAFLGINILEAAVVIGATTFFCSLLGVLIGNRFGIRYKKRAETAGGVILVAIGFKILLEHLGIL